MTTIIFDSSKERIDWGGISYPCLVIDTYSNLAKLFADIGKEVDLTQKAPDFKTVLKEIEQKIQEIDEIKKIFESKETLKQIEKTSQILEESISTKKQIYELQKRMIDGTN